MAEKVTFREMILITFDREGDITSAREHWVETYVDETGKEIARKADEVRPLSTVALGKSLPPQIALVAQVTELKGQVAAAVVEKHAAVNAAEAKVALLEEQVATLEANLADKRKPAKE